VVEYIEDICPGGRVHWRYMPWW